jgi:dienelactone hydrolase family protein
MNRSAVVAACVALALAGAIAQQEHFAFPPASPGVTVSRDLEYGTSGGTSLRMDIYRPPAAGTRGPVLIFFNRATGADRSSAFWSAWAKTAATKGLIAILPDLRDGSEAQDFDVLVEHLARHAEQIGIDREAIAVYAASGNVSAAFAAVEDPKQTAVKAAVMYYGTSRITEFRRDLPVLYVRAGLDRPGVNKEITALAALAVSQNAPVTLLNYPGGYHAFEIFNDDDATREVIDVTLDFVKRVTAASYQAALRRGVSEATAAGYVLTGNFREAASTYAELVASRPDDPRLRLAYGEALLGGAQYAAACAEFEKLKGQGLGPRDLGVPAARACAQKGDSDAAVAWLTSIPPRFRPADLATDPAFAALRSRPDFRALFPSR